MQTKGDDALSGSDWEDFHYFSELARRESDRIFASLKPSLDDSVPKAAGIAMQQLAIRAGELAARVQILEDALELQLAYADPFRDGPLLRGAQRLAVEDLIDGLDCHASEFGQGGRELVWTKSPEMRFRLIANRTRAKFARLWFEAIIKPEYAKDLTVQVDGRRQRHAVISRDGHYAIEWELPQNDDLAPTEVVITLPGVHSPREIGQSDDTRTLGIAITGLEFDGARRQPLLTRLLRR